MAALVYISLTAKDDKYFLRHFLVIVNSSFENFAQIHRAFFLGSFVLQLCSSGSFLFFILSFFLNSLYILDIFYQLDRAKDRLILYELPLHFSNCLIYCTENFQFMKSTCKLMSLISRWKECSSTSPFLYL